MARSIILALCLAVMAVGKPYYKTVMYFTGQHIVFPPWELVQEITHVNIAFLRSEQFFDPLQTEWTLFTTVPEVRSHFAPGTKVLLAVGGWGDNRFHEAAETIATRENFARNIARVVKKLGLDGVDIDWEYPGGNGENWKKVPNEEKVSEIEHYPLLLAAIRRALDGMPESEHKIMSAAVPGLPRDMLAFTAKTLPHIMESLDYLNVMTYDMLNRRDSHCGHHSSIALSAMSVDTYISRGVKPRDINLGFAWYTKFFNVQPGDRDGPTWNCRLLPGEDPITGEDMRNGGGFSWHEPEETDVVVKDSFQRALTEGVYDEFEGGYYYWDKKHDIWWTFETPHAVKEKVALIGTRGLGGGFAWGLGEDAPKFEHLIAYNEAIEKLEREHERHPEPPETPEHGDAGDNEIVVVTPPAWTEERHGS